MCCLNCEIYQILMHFNIWAKIHILIHHISNYCHSFMQSVHMLADMLVLSDELKVFSVAKNAVHSENQT